jgi:hypothetical protein
MKTAAEFYQLFERAGFLTPATWYPRTAEATPVPGMVRFRKPTQEVYGDAVIVTDHSIKFPATQFEGLQQGDMVDVGTAPLVQRFRVKETPANDDGAQRIAYLHQVQTGTALPPPLPAPAPGAGSNAGLDSAPLAFAFGDASPRNMLPVLANQTVLQVNINITTPFNGAGASFSLGTFAQPELLVSPQNVDLGIPTEFEVNPNVLLTAPTDIVLTLNAGAGATQGAGWLVIQRVGS